MYRVECSVYPVQCTVYSVHCTVHNEKCRGGKQRASIILVMEALCDHLQPLKELNMETAGEV